MLGVINTQMSVALSHLAANQSSDVLNSVNCMDTSYVFDTHTLRGEMRIMSSEQLSETCHLLYACQKSLNTILPCRMCRMMSGNRVNVSRRRTKLKKPSPVES